MKLEDRMNAAFNQVQKAGLFLHRGSFNWGFIEGIFAMTEIEREYQRAMQRRERH